MSMMCVVCSFTNDGDDEHVALIIVKAICELDIRNVSHSCSQTPTRAHAEENNHKYLLIPLHRLLQSLHAECVVACMLSFYGPLISSACGRVGQSCWHA